jgi:LuxR family maltose regulon positive regulatory protein
MVRRAQGRLREVRKMSQTVLQGTQRDGRTLPVAGAFLAYLLLGLTQCEQNELDEAERTLGDCALLAVQYQVPTYELLAQFYLGQVRAARGDVAGALRLVEHALATADRYLSPVNQRELDGYRVMLWLRQGDIARASEWASRQAPAMHSGRPRFTPYDYDRFALVQTQMAQGDLDAAYVGMSRLLEDAEATGHGRYVIWALIWQALIRHAQGKVVEALVPLARALALAAPEGYIRVFVDEGAPMAVLLREALKRGVVPDYVARLLAAFPPQSVLGAGPGEPAPGRLVVPMQAAAEPLSLRELEVLRLLATGHDNTEIARSLVVAVSTVKSHVNHIFGKLGVRTRVEAVLRAQEQRLL